MPAARQEAPPNGQRLHQVATGDTSDLPRWLVLDPIASEVFGCLQKSTDKEHSFNLEHLLPSKESQDVEGQAGPPRPQLQVAAPAPLDTEHGGAAGQGTVRRKERRRPHSNSLPSEKLLAPRQPCDSWTSSRSLTWETVRSANSRAPPATATLKSLKKGPSKLCLKQNLHVHLSLRKSLGAALRSFPLSYPVVPPTGQTPPVLAGY